MEAIDLEDEIMSVWSTTDDIDTLLYRYLESSAGPLSEDDISNTLLGIKALHDQRCQRLWDAFEKVLANNVMPVKSATPELSSTDDDMALGYDSNGIRLQGPLLCEDDGE